MSNHITGAPIELVGVTKRYPGQEAPAVNNVTLSISAGEIVCLVGPSGCGKTTTMKLINRLIEPTAGTITIGGNDVTTQQADELRRGIGYVIQNAGLFPHYTVAENVAVVPRLLGWNKARVADRTAELLTMVGLDNKTFAQRYPAQLSGGQQQRVGVARALAADPPVLLMDEPFGAVDPITRLHLQDELLNLNETLRKTIVFVTHDFDEAIKLGNRIAILAAGSRIVQYAPPAEILANPADDFVVQFIGPGAAVKLLHATQVADIELDSCPTVQKRQTVTEVRTQWGDDVPDWALILDGSRPVAWIEKATLAAATPNSFVGDIGTPITEVIRGRATVQDALESLLASDTEFVPVAERGRYRGIISLSTVQRAIVALRDTARSTAPTSAPPDAPQVRA